MRSQRHRNDIARTSQRQKNKFFYKVKNTPTLSLAHTRGVLLLGLLQIPLPPLLSTTTSYPGLPPLLCLSSSTSSSASPPPTRKPKTEKAVACSTTRKNKPRTKSSTLGSPETLSHERSVTNPKYTHDTQVKHAQSHTQFLPHCTPPLPAP